MTELAPAHSLFSFNFRSFSSFNFRSTNSCTVVETATSIAALWFNNGHKGFEGVLQELGIVPTRELIRSE